MSDEVPIYWHISAEADVTGRPVGTMDPALRAEVSPGWLLLNGQSCSRQEHDYPDLWRWAQDSDLVWPGQFEDGHDGKTFVLPDFTGRTVSIQRRREQGAGQ